MKLKSLNQCSGRVHVAQLSFNLGETEGDVWMFVSGVGLPIVLDSGIGHAHVRVAPAKMCPHTRIIAVCQEFPEVPCNPSERSYPAPCFSLSPVVFFRHLANHI